MPSSRRKSPRCSRWRTVVSACATPVTLGRPRRPQVTAGRVRRQARRADLAVPPAGSDASPRPRWGTLDAMTPVPASPDPESGPPVRPATGSSSRAGRPGALHRPARRRPPRLPAGRDAGAHRPHLRRHRRLRARPLRHRHARRRPRPAEPGGDPRRAARLVRPRRRPRGVPRGRALRDRHRALPGRRRPAAAADDDSPLRRVAGDVYLVDLDSDPADLQEELTGLRVFAGYAGWSPGQLAGEIAEGAWACVPGRPDDVLSPAAGPGAVARRDGPADRPARRALHRPGGPIRQLRVPGSLRIW